MPRGPSRGPTRPSRAGASHAPDGRAEPSPARPFSLKRPGLALARPEPKPIILYAAGGAATAGRQGCGRGVDLTGKKRAMERSGGEICRTLERLLAACARVESVLWRWG